MQPQTAALVRCHQPAPAPAGRPHSVVVADGSDGETEQRKIKKAARLGLEVKL
jgi:hypothetical protein